MSRMSTPHSQHSQQSFDSAQSEFRQIRPRGRDERRQNFNRDVLEKARLSERRENFNRWEDPGSIIACQEEGVGFMTESDRFHTDTAGEEKRHREAQLRHKEEILDHKREVTLQREEDRWKRIEESQRAEQERQDKLKFTQKAKANENSVPYDPITQRYNDGLDGQRLAHSDNMLKYKADVRANYLYNKTSGDGYNPITGEKRPDFDMPAKPEWREPTPQQ